MKRNLTILISLAILSLANPSFAQTLYWDGGTIDIPGPGDGISQGGAGTWDTTITNWDQGDGLAHIAWDNAQNYDAYLAGTAGTVTLGAPITANSLTFSAASGYIISDGGNAANTLTLNAATNNVNATVGANIINSTSFTKVGSSTLTLINVSSGLTGTLSVNGGTLTLGDNNVNNGPTGFGDVSVAANATFQIRNATSTSYAQTISGEGSVSISDKNSSTTTTLSGANTYSGKTTVNQATLAVSSIDESGPNNLGTGPLQIGAGASATAFTYAFPGGDVTTSRPLIFGGTVNPAINNLSSGTLTLAGPVSYATSATTPKSIVLAGNMPGVFASSIPDNITLTTTNATTLQKKDTGTWSLTASNSFSGGVTFLGGSSGHNGVLLITNDTALGSATAFINFKTNSTSGCDAAISSTTFPVTIAASRTVKLNGTVGGFTIKAGFSTTDANSLNVAAYITGVGNVSRASSSISFGAVRFSNDANDYTGDFSTGYGATEFTSVANAGLPSALGAGSTAYAIGNSSSYANLRYVGSGDTSTTRAINWQATTGGLSLDNTGSGSVQYLATASIRSGSGNAGLTLTGSNTGANTLAQVVNDGAVSGTTTLAKSGAGKWILTGLNTYSGATTISGGNLSVGSDANLGTAPVSATPGSLTISAGALSVSASFTLDANRGIALGPTSGTGGGTLDVAGGSTLTYGGVIGNNGSGEGALSKTSGGTLSLSGVETYTGDTRINSGTLALTGSGSISSSPNIIVGNGATLDVSGVGGGYSLAASQTLQAIIGATATINGSLDLSSAALVMTNTPNTATMAVTGGALTLSGGTVVTVNVNNGGNGLTGGNYILIAKGTGGSVAGTAPAAVTVGGDGLASGATAELSISGGELYLVVTGGTLTPPVVDSFGLGGGGVVLSFSGPNGQTWKILTSTNVAKPLPDWDTVTSGTFAGVTVNYTNTSIAEPQRYYRVSSP